MPYGRLKYNIYVYVYSHIIENTKIIKLYYIIFYLLLTNYKSIYKQYIKLNKKLIITQYFLLT